MQMDTTESEIRSLVESAKISKILKDKLISYARAKDVELDLLKTDIRNLKADYARKSEVLEERILNLENNEITTNQLKVTSFEKKINQLQKAYQTFKQNL